MHPVRKDNYLKILFIFYFYLLKHFKFVTALLIILGTFQIYNLHMISIRDDIRTVSV